MTIKNNKGGFFSKVSERPKMVEAISMVHLWDLTLASNSQDMTQPIGVMKCSQKPPFHEMPKIPPLDPRMSRLTTSLEMR